MTYRAHETIPPYERVRFDPESNRSHPAAPGNLKWGSDDAPPPVGARIRCTINNCGPAVVTGYFEQDGYLGVRCTLLDPPDWFKRQNGPTATDGHVFGPEFRLEQEA